MKKILMMLLIVSLIIAMIGCTSTTNEAINNETTEDVVENTQEETTKESKDETTEESVEEPEEESEEEKELLPILIDPNQLSDENRPYVTIEMEDGQKIVLKLIPEIAPNTVNNFISLIDQGFYDGIIFHRIINNFMIQGGDPLGTGQGGPGYSIKDEFYIFDEEAYSVTYLPHSRGALSMAKTSAPDSAGSQFFIVHQDANGLDLKYATFGFVVEGMDVVDYLATVALDGERPIENQVMKTVTVELNGYDFTEPEIIE